MLDSGDLELAVGYLKSIVESCRCPICDTGSGGRLRYDCGHVACPDCAEVAPACQLCTPPQGSGDLVHDERLTRRVLHVAELVKSFQEAYNIDVLKSKRISDQQRVERSLFPQCIQAPQTYSNKRKSYTIPRKSKGKENISILPGELICEPVIMNKSENYVEKWLDQHDEDFKKYQPRQPFADLSVNSPKVNRTPAKKTLSLKKSQTPSKSAKKRPFETTLSGNSKSQSILDKYQKETNKSNISERAKRIKKELAKIQNEDRDIRGRDTVQNVKKDEKDESGIELDDGPIILDDSQDEVVSDKDKAAWLAVIEADKMECTSKSNIESVKPKETHITYHKPVPSSPINVFNWMCSDTEIPSATRKSYRVPFYKKASLAKPCKLSHDTDLKNNSIARIATPNEDKNISIIVETSTLRTKITVNKSKLNNSKYISSSSQAIQTDLCKETSSISNQNMKILESEDMFTMENKDIAETVNMLPKAVTKKASCVDKLIETRDKEINVIESKKLEPEAKIDIPVEPTITAVNLKDLENEKAVLLLTSTSPSLLTNTSVSKGPSLLTNTSVSKDKENKDTIFLLDTSSDSEHELSGNITVTADVRRSHEDCDIQGVLREISLSEIRVPKAVKRGITPTSTDSSDKENRDPNTKKRRRDGKKSRKKHKL